MYNKVYIFKRHSISISLASGSPSPPSPRPGPPARTGGALRPHALAWQPSPHGHAPLRASCRLWPGTAPARSCGRLYHRTGHIKIGRRVVREHAHGYFERFVNCLCQDYAV